MHNTCSITQFRKGTLTESFAFLSIDSVIFNVVLPSVHSKSEVVIHIGATFLKVYVRWRKQAPSSRESHCHAFMFYSGVFIII